MLQLHLSDSQHHTPWVGGSRWGKNVGAIQLRSITQTWRGFNRRERTPWASQDKGQRMCFDHLWAPQNSISERISTWSDEKSRLKNPMDFSESQPVGPCPSPLQDLKHGWVYHPIPLKLHQRRASGHCPHVQAVLAPPATSGMKTRYLEGWWVPDFHFHSLYKCDSINCSKAQITNNGCWCVHNPKIN